MATSMAGVYSYQIITAQETFTGRFTKVE